MPSIAIGETEKPKCKKCGNPARSVGVNKTKTRRRYISLCKGCQRKVRKLAKAASQ